MNRREKVEWLERFLDIWDRDCCRGERHLSRLCDIYIAFCDRAGLPLFSADDNLYSLYRHAGRR